MTITANFCGTGYTSNTGLAHWTNPNNITLDDGTPATLSTNQSLLNCDYLIASNFGFAIPGTATIAGISVTANNQYVTGLISNNGNATDVSSSANLFSNIYLTTDGSTTSGIDLQNSGGASRSTNSSYTLGTYGVSGTNSWSNSLTPAIVNGSTFGVMMRIGAISSTIGWNVDSVKMFVYWYDQSSGALTAGTGLNVASGGGLNWTDPNNVTLNDGSSYATCTVSSTTQSNYLVCSNFGFALPADAVIEGVQVTYNHFRNGGTTGAVRDNTVQLYNGSTGLPLGSNKATSTNWPTTSTSISYGGIADLWGATIGPGLINQSTFSVLIAVQGAAAGANRVANVNDVQVTVYYNTNLTATSTNNLFWCFPA